LIVAKAALDRLLSAPAVGADDFHETGNELRRALSQCRFMVMPLRENPSAPAQGALAIEISRRRDDLRSVGRPINCVETFRRGRTHEREILRALWWRLSSKIGASVLRRSFGEVTFLRGVTDDGRVLDGCSLQASKPRPARVSSELLWPVDRRIRTVYSRDCDQIPRIEEICGDFQRTVATPSGLLKLTRCLMIG
jgi:hydroxymethylbilane synthase